VAFNHNGDQTGKPARSKSAGKTSGGKTSSSEDVRAKPAAKKRAKAAKKSSAKKAAKRSTRRKQTVASGASSQTVCEVDESAAEAQELDPIEAAKQTMKGAVPAIVKAMVKKAKEGSCSHAKTLLEMAGAKQMFVEDREAQEKGEPWAKLVLERMEQAEQESFEETRKTAEP
jgi:hypothetical protein